MQWRASADGGGGGERPRWRDSGGNATHLRSDSLGEFCIQDLLEIRVEGGRLCLCR